jgi:hypothetical protein
MACGGSDAHLHERDGARDVDAVVRQRDLPALPDRLERGEMNDGPDAAVGSKLLEDAVDARRVAEVDLAE